MATITFTDFALGLDVRKGPSTSEANRLRRIDNAYVTTGKSIRKRPGWEKIATLEPGTIGLESGLGKLNTFYGGNESITHADTRFAARKLVTSGKLGVETVYGADVFNGYLYVAAGHAGAVNRHHYLDGTAVTEVTDSKCPHTPVFIKKTSKIFSVSQDGDTVRFCKTNFPRDWTTANDAGFLPVGLQQRGATDCVALGEFNNQLVAFFPDSAQVWTIDPDPTKMSLAQTVDIGTTHKASHAGMGGDVFFLSPSGVRSVGMAYQSGNLIDTDVGSPVDSIVRDVLTGQVNGFYYKGGGQYWLVSGNKALVYSFSRTAKISAWSVYTFAFPLEYVTELDAVLYARSGDTVYRFDPDVSTDDGVPFSVDIEMAYLDFQSPGILKQLHSLDMVISGEGEVQFKYDPRDPSLVTSPPVPAFGDTRPGYMLPVELLATSIAPVIHHAANGPFELHALTFYFDKLGPV